MRIVRQAIQTALALALLAGPAFAAPQATPSPKSITASGLEMIRNGTSGDGPTPLVELSDIRSGGPPPDGIPSIDQPKFVGVRDADYLADSEPVLALEINGDARAYPVQVLIWHEIANDEVGGVPVAITYCPLCNSAVAVDRRVGDRVLEFGTSGMLLNSSLVMYDRQTETLWSHFTGQGIVGELTGVQLKKFPVPTVSWKSWRDANPEGMVLTRETGVERDYGRNPYPGYDDVGTAPFLFQGESDGRLAAKTRIVGISVPPDAVAVPLDALKKERVHTVSLNSERHVILWQAGTSSALDASSIADGVDVGATGVFRSAIDGEELTFRSAGTNFVDDQSNSQWNIFGTAIAGERAGAQLEQIDHIDTFWFAWAAFQPDSRIVGSVAPTQPTEKKGAPFTLWLGLAGLAAVVGLAFFLGRRRRL